MARTSRRVSATDLGLAALASVGLAACACVPSDPGYTEEVAVRRTSTGEVEALPCTSATMREVVVSRVETVESTAEDPESEILWQFELDPPQTIDGLVLGEAPPGAEVTVAWPREGLVDEPGSHFAVTFRQANAEANRGHTFRLSDVEGDVVLFDQQSMTAAQFDSSDLCDAPPPR